MSRCPQRSDASWIDSIALSDSARYSTYRRDLKKRLRSFLVPEPLVLLRQNYC